MKNAKAFVVELKGVVDRWKPSPRELRFAFKQVRKETGLYIELREKKLPRYLTPAEVYGFLEVAQGVSPAHRLLGEILFQTGLRISELQSMDIRDLKHDGNVLLVRSGKGGKDRMVPIGNNLLHKISLYTQERSAGRIFLKSDHTPLSVRALQHWFQTIGVKAGLGVMNPHVARHTYACLLINKGIPLEQVQLYMGHSSRITTEIYAKLTFTPEQKMKYLSLFP